MSVERYETLWPVAVFLSLIILNQETLGRDPVNLVILPPIQSSLSNDMGESVTFLSDQLAAELAKDPEIHVVDRKQIDRVFEEKAIAPVAKPALAYDVLLRVNIDLSKANPLVVLQVVDLSTGNPAGSSEWPWTAETPADRLEEMAKTCKESAMKALSISQGKVKVRLLGVATPHGMDRLQPMREHFEQMIDQVVARSSKVCVVQHLEALTVKEESLLLLLGHTKLAGERQFAPQADKLLTAELVETDARGKTFENTLIEIRFRLDQTGQKNDWTRVQGKVADWSKLAPRACQLLVEQLGQATPETAAQYVTEMLDRRRQAEAELQVALRQRDSKGQPNLTHLAAAAKLDPTYEEAAYWIIASYDGPIGYREDAIPEVIQYIERFPRGKHRNSVMTRLTLYCLDKLPKDLQQTETLRKIVALNMTEDVRDYHTNCGFLVEKVCRGWMASGVDQAGCKQWLEQIRRRVEIFTAQIANEKFASRFDVERSLLEIRSFFVTFAVETGDKPQALQRLQEFMTYGRVVSRNGGNLAKDLRETVFKMADQQLLAKYDRWLVERTTPVKEITLAWNDYPVYHDVCLIEKVRRFSPMLPLAASPTAVYGISGSFISDFGPEELRRNGQAVRQTLLRIPVDGKGMPTHDALPLVSPTLNRELAVTCAAFHAGTLYVGTKHTGLLAYNVADEKWRQITPDQGLPEWYVNYVHPFDEKTLLVVAGDPKTGRVSYSSLDVISNQLKLINRLDSNFAPFSFWRQDDQMMAINRYGLIRDINHKPQYLLKWPNIQPYGWQPSVHGVNPLANMVEVGESRYVMSYAGLHQIDNQCNVIRSWWRRRSFSPNSQDLFELSRNFINTPGDFPTDHSHSDPDSGGQREFIAQSNGHLFLVSPVDGILCYDPPSDNWFGPLEVAPDFSIEWPLGSTEGLWVGGDQGTAYFRTIDFIEAAKAAGRVMTTAEVRQRKRELAEQAGPLEVAKFDLLTRDFEGAGRRLEAVLASNPTDPQALLLMAVLHDFWCKNRPDEALEWYRKLSAIESNRSAVLTGLHGEFRINYTLGRWEQAILIGERLLDETPCLDGSENAFGGMASKIEQYIESAREKRDIAKSINPGRK